MASAISVDVVGRTRGLKTFGVPGGMAGVAVLASTPVAHCWQWMPTSTDEKNAGVVAPAISSMRSRAGKFWAVRSFKTTFHP